MEKQMVIEAISEFWPDYFEIAGQENVNNIVEDVLSGSDASEKFALPPMGHHFDITIDLSVILSSIQVIIAVTQCIISLKGNNEKDTKKETIKKISSMNFKALEHLDDHEIESLIIYVLKNSHYDR